MDRTPEHEAFCFIQRQINSGVGTWSECALLYPEEIVLARKHRALVTQQHRLKKAAHRKASYAHLEAVSWLDIQEDAATYKRLAEGRRRPENEDIKEVKQYYNLVLRKDLEKRRLHPEIKPLSLGGDPRLRDWPSGRISYNLFYYTKVNKRKNYRRKRGK